MLSRYSKSLSWIFGVLSVIFFSLAILGVISLGYQGFVPPNTIVGSTTVGGLSNDRAVEMIEQDARQIEAQAIEVKIGSQTRSLTPTELGISLEPASVDFIEPPNSAHWLNLSYWQSFLSEKRHPMIYQINRQAMLETLYQSFELQSNSQNAEIFIDEQGDLAIKEAQSGADIVVESVIDTLKGQLAIGQISSLEFDYKGTSASISTEQATQTKAEIERSLSPVRLTGDSRIFIISKRDQYKLIDYQIEGGELSWTISEEKLKDYLTTSIASRLNIRMLEKIIQDRPEMTIQEGRDGRAVGVDSLTQQVYERLTSGGGGELIEVPLSEVPFTEKRVAADYIPGLFPGIYVDINLAKQKMTIVDGEYAVQSFIISSGKASTPTPRGIFYIKNKFEIAQSRLYPGLWLRKWNALARNPDGSGYEGYGIHDLPCFNPNCTRVEGASHLGRPVSAGCVRLGNNDATWFFDNIPVGTPVNIH